MMVFNQLNMEVYDKAAVEIGYCKMFKHIVEDFITRQDMIQILNPSNLPVNTGVNTIVAGAAGPYPVVAKGTGSGTGTVAPIYNGSSLSPGSNALKEQKKLIQEAGGTAINSALGEVSNL